MDVMQIMGMDPAELEEMLDAVKASNEYTAGAMATIERMLPRIRELTSVRGWSKEDVSWLVSSLGAYADYSFNRAHADSYGYVAYFTAWMRTNHPLAFWTAMLVSYADHDNVSKYIVETRKDGIRILPPHVNRSQVSYTPEPELNAIRKGLIAVSGIGPSSAAELAAKAPYSSLTDLAERVVFAKVTGTKPFLLQGLDPYTAGGQLAKLEDANALEGLTR